MLTYYNFVGRKFDVTYTSEEELEMRLAMYEPQYSRPKLWDQWFLSIIQDEARWGFNGKNLNDALPQIRPMGIKGFLETWWAKA